MSKGAIFVEHDEEPVPGLPGPLPQGETILWQGAPGWTGLALRALHVRAVALYFVLLALWRGAALTEDGATTAEALSGALFLLVLGAIPVALLMGYAWFSGRSTIYTITNRRIIVRTGVALPMAINIPFALIDSAAVARRTDGSGDILLGVAKPHRVSWVALWPHTRSFRVLRAQPMLRALADVEGVAQVLGRALAASAAAPVKPVASEPARPAPAGERAAAMA
jgi:hypothetical protein